jgi:hypothetical protein
VFDAHHALDLARFWDAVLDSHTLLPFDDDDLAWLAERGHDVDNPPSVALDPIAGSGGLRIWFNNVPDPTPGKNRIHVDVVSRPEEHGERWWILADPEGNQFCAFPPG